MYIKEMHIEVSQATQNIAANVRRKLLPEEIDWLLNKNQQRFIQSKVKPKPENSGEEISQLDVDAIRTLIKTVELPVEAIDGYFNAYLPADYQHLLNDESRVTKICGTATAVSSTVNENVLQLPFASTVKDTAPYYASVILTVGQKNISLQEVIDFFQATGYSGLRSKAEIFTVTDALLWYLRNQLKIDVYWENYRGIFKPRTFLLPGVSTGAIAVDGDIKQAAAVSSSYSTYTLDGDRWSTNRLVPVTKAASMNNTPFVKTDYRAPLSEVSGNYLIVYGDASFIVSKVRVQYVKKPRRMSLILGQDCELPEGFHQAICDLTAEYIKAMTADPNWEVKLKDNMLRSIPNQ